MSENFLKFKQRLNAIRIARSAFIGVSAGLGASGIWLMLIKLVVINFEPLTTLIVGIGLTLLVGVAVFIFSRKSDKVFAAELDGMFDLKARVQTMVEYDGQQGEVINLQRQDADEALSKIPTKSYKFKGLWIHILAVVLCAAIFVGGFIVPDMRYYVPPEEIEPFELTAMQEAGLGELIKYVETSSMEEEFKDPIVDELRTLLEELKITTTKPDMQAALAKSMAVICSITYDSSTATEMLNALWDSGDIYFRYLANTLDTSAWTAPDWADFAEKLNEYTVVLMGDKNEGEGALTGGASLKWAIESMIRKIDVVLSSSGLAEDDEIYASLVKLFYSNPGGFEQIAKTVDTLTDDEARDLLVQSLNLNSSSLYEAISLNKINANVGEYAMTRLAGLFLVPLPEFERPEFVKNGESVEGGSGSGTDEDKENGTNDGGIGEGATFGTDDYVLDPMTGEYVQVGELIHRYNAIMNERLESGNYTEAQKEAIRKYFDLLYSGIEKEEGK